MRNKIYIGTSGWSYDHWKENFYPKDISNNQWLAYYCKHFNTVEVNNTFYQLPNDKTFKKWYKNSSKDFKFAVKGSRYITHMKNLNEVEKPLNNFHSKYDLLKEKGGPILFQLPPQWNLNFKRLKSFINILKPEIKYVFEFRNETWYIQKVYDLLKDNNIAFCIHDHIDAPSPKIITADFTYLRFHGSSGDYRSKYSKKQLKDKADFIKKQNIPTYCYFNNDKNAYAVENAMSLKKRGPSH